MDIIKRLTQIEGLNLHIFESEKQAFNEFILGLQEKLPSSTYLAVIDGNKIYSLDELFNTFSSAFKFPDYFGKNWAAFDECINDLDWLGASSYILILKDTDILLKYEQNFNILIKTLCQTANEWSNGRNYDSFPTPPTPFHIIFGVSLNNGKEVEKRIREEGFQSIEFLDYKDIFSPKQTHQLCW